MPPKLRPDLPKIKVPIKAHRPKNRSVDWSPEVTRDIIERANALLKGHTAPDNEEEEKSKT